MIVRWHVILFNCDGKDSVMLKDVFMEHILCQTYFCWVSLHDFKLYLHLQSNRRTQQQLDTGIGPSGTFFKDSKHNNLYTPKISGLDPRFSSLDSSFLQGEGPTFKCHFCLREYSCTFPNRPWFWLDYPTFSPPWVYRCIAELHRSLECGVAPVFVGGHQHGVTWALCRRICCGHGHFQGSRRWGILSPQCKVLRRGPWRIATLRTRGRRCDTWLGKQEKGWIFLFPEHDEDVDYILSCCWNRVKYVTKTTGVFVWCL